MRLIDADELKELRHQYIQGHIKFDGNEYDLIDRCPTIDPTSELKHFLEAEIQITVERQMDELSSIYDGVAVGRAEAVQLRNRHIKFCKYLLYLCEKGDNNATDVH